MFIEGVDQYMANVERAIRRHVRDQATITEIYNRAYEAVVMSMDAKMAEIAVLRTRAEHAERERDALKAATRWIPVSEGLPKVENYVSDSVLAWTGEVELLSFVPEDWVTNDWTYRQGWYRHPGSEPIDETVTHWQPLPAPPESEEEMSEKLPPVERSTVGSGTNFRSKTVNPQM